VIQYVYVRRLAICRSLRLVQSGRPTPDQSVREMSFLASRARTYETRRPDNSSPDCIAQRRRNRKPTRYQLPVIGRRRPSLPAVEAGRAELLSVILVARFFFQFDAANAISLRLARGGRIAYHGIALNKLRIHARFLCRLLSTYCRCDWILSSIFIWSSLLLRKTELFNFVLHTVR